VNVAFASSQHERKNESDHPDYSAANQKTVPFELKELNVAILTRGGILASALQMA